MANFNIKRLNEDIRRELSSAVSGVKDPRVADGFVTITHCELTSDMSYCKVGVACMGGENRTAKAVEGMNRIVEDINRVTDEISLINSAAVEQKNSITFINDNMIKIENGMQSTTATAEESAASGEELSSMSINLAETVEKYKTE